MNTISYAIEDSGSLVPKPPKGTKSGKPLKSGKRENEYYQKKKIQELSSKIKREKSGDREGATSKQKQQILKEPKGSRSKVRKDDFQRALEGMFGCNVSYDAEQKNRRLKEIAGAQDK
jgi:hypothetical protein